MDAHTHSVRCLGLFILIVLVLLFPASGNSHPSMQQDDDTCAKFVPQPPAQPDQTAAGSEPDPRFAVWGEISPDKKRMLSLLLRSPARWGTSISW